MDAPALPEGEDPVNRACRIGVVVGVRLACGAVTAVRRGPARAGALAGSLLLLLLTAVVFPQRAAAAPGWRQVFSTDFTGTALPKGCGKYGGPYPGGATYWDEDNVVVSGGMLRIVIEKRTQGSMPYTAGGMGCFDAARTYGKFEWRAKVPLGKGIDSYATLWMADEADTGNESLVEILGVPGAETMAVSNGYGAGMVGEHIAGRYSDAFHTYTIEWLPDRFRVLVDGVQKYSSTRAPRVSKWLGFAVSNGDNFAGLPDAATVLPAEFQVDWARIYAYVPDAPAPSKSVAPSGAPAVPTGPASGTSLAAGAPASIPSATATGGPAVDPVPGRPTGTPAWAWFAGGALLLSLGAGAVRLALRRRRVGAD